MRSKEERYDSILDTPRRLAVPVSGGRVSEGLRPEVRHTHPQASSAMRVGGPCPCVPALLGTQRASSQLDSHTHTLPVRLPIAS